MIPVDLVVGAPMAAALGFAYGMGPCLVSCFPFLGPVFLANDAGIRDSWKIMLPLSLGRLTTYILFGGLAGVMGRFVKVSVAAGSINGIVGCAALTMGLALLMKRSSSRACNSSVQPGWKPLQRMNGGHRELLPLGVYMMGVGMALSPCAPLSIVMFSAAMTGSAAGGTLLGASFGIGAIVIPAFVYGIGMAYLGNRLREQLRGWLPSIEKLSAVMLVAVGVSNLVKGIANLVT